MIELHVVVVVVDTEKIRRGESEVCALGHSSKPNKRPKPCPECAYTVIAVNMYTSTYTLYIARVSECSDIQMHTQEPPIGI